MEGHITEILQVGFTALPVVLGFDLDLFAALELKPLTAYDIAKKRNVSERFVREWLNTMVASGIVLTEQSGTTYWVSTDVHRELVEINGSHLKPLALLLPKFASLYNIAKDSATLCSSGDEATDRTPVDNFKRAMYMISNDAFTRAAVNDIVDSLPTDLIEMLENGHTNYLDIGCGYGAFSRRLGVKYPSGQFWGTDSDKQCIDYATDQATKQGLSNVHYYQNNGLQSCEAREYRFDWITVSHFLHDCDNQEALLIQIKQCLKDNGYLSVFEPKAHSNPAKNAGDPVATIQYTFSLFYCLQLCQDKSLLANRPGAMWGREELEKLLESHGFEIIKATDIDMWDTHYVCRKARRM